jgi:Flp pilus assembly protein TadG
MLEFAIVSVVAFFLMFGMADAALIVLGNSVGSNAARDGARVGIINYEDADVTGSVNHQAVKAAVLKRLSGNIASPAVTVACRPASNLALTVACQPGTVTLGRDVIEVRVTWTHKGSSPFLLSTSHSAISRMVIGGAPDLTTATTTPASTTTTTTTPSSTTTTTGPPPVLSTLTMWDDNHNGKVDTIRATFSGALNAGCDDNWSPSGAVPSGGSLSSVAVSGNVATLILSEGAGAPDTTVGTLKVSFSSDCNAIGFGATAPADKAPPAVVAISSTNHPGGIAGQMEANDTLVVTFSEPIAAAGVPTGAVTVTEDGNYPSDNLEITGVTNGYVPTGGNYVSPDSKTAWFPGSSVASSADNKTLTVTVGGTCTGDCSKLMPGSGDLEFTPANTLRDAAGNVAVANGVTPGVNIALF